MEFPMVENQLKINKKSYCLMTPKIGKYCLSGDTSKKFWVINFGLWVILNKYKSPHNFVKKIVIFANGWR